MQRRLQQPNFFDILLYRDSRHEAAEQRRQRVSSITTWTRQLPPTGPPEWDQSTTQHRAGFFIRAGRRELSPIHTSCCWRSLLAESQVVRCRRCGDWSQHGSRVADSTCSHKEDRGHRSARSARSAVREVSACCPQPVTQARSSGPLHLFSRISSLSSAHRATLLRNDLDNDSSTPPPRSDRWLLHSSSASQRLSASAVSSQHRTVHEAAQHQASRCRLLHRLVLLHTARRASHHRRHLGILAAWQPLTQRTHRFWRAGAHSQLLDSFSATRQPFVTLLHPLTRDSA